jgi:hypothetical protein
VIDLIPAIFEFIAQTHGVEASGPVSPDLLLGVEEVTLLED